MHPPLLRIVADDLTGALDSAAAFAGLTGGVAVGWDGAWPEARAAALDLASREGSASEAARRAGEAAAGLMAGPDCLAFLKLDSLLRGHAAAELAAILAHRPGFSHVLVAPAIPGQNRVTRGGRQMWHTAGGWQATGEDLGAALGRLGHGVRLAGPEAPLEPGITLVDCASDADLDRLARVGLTSGKPILWVGASGLSAALARALGAPAVAPGRIGRPLLGLIGSHHPVMLAQLEAVAGAWLTTDGSAGAEAAIGSRLAAEGAVFVTADLPPGLDRAAAARRIAALFCRLAETLPCPGTLFVSGGETLRAIMPALGARALTVTGESEPGAPLSRLEGGRCAGLTILSKSGAFGRPDVLRRLIAALPPRESSHA